MFKSVNLKYILLTTFFLLGACQTQKLKSPKSHNTSDRKKRAPNEKKFTEVYLKLSEDLAPFDREFLRFKQKISAYKKTSSYQKPKDEEEKEFNSLVDLAAMFKKEDLQELMQKKEFQTLFERAKNFKKYKKMSNVLVEGKKTAVKMQLADNTPPPEEEEEKESKSDLKTTMAAIFITIPTLAAIKYVFHPLYKAEKTKKSINFSKGRHPLTKIMIGYFYARMFFAGLALVGNVNEKDILQTRDFIFDSGVALGIVSIAYLFLSLNQFKDQKTKSTWLKKSVNFIVENTEKQVLRNKKFKLEDLADKGNSNIKKKTKDKGLGMFAAAAVLIIGSQLLLAEETNPKEKMVYEFIRFFAACHKHEKSL